MQYRMDEGDFQGDDGYDQEAVDTQQHDRQQQEESDPWLIATDSPMLIARRRQYQNALDAQVPAEIVDEAWAAVQAEQQKQT